MGNTQPSPYTHADQCKHGEDQLIQESQASCPPRTQHARKEEPPRPPGTRTVEPRARPAATRGPRPCPQTGNAATKTDSRTDKEHERRYTPESPRHLKSLVLAVEVAGEVALDAAADLPVGFAFGAAALDVGQGGRVAAHAADSDDVQGAVELPIAEPVEAELRITSVSRALLAGFKARASFRFTGCCWWRSLAVDGGSGASREHAVMRRPGARWSCACRTTVPGTVR